MPVTLVAKSGIMYLTIWAFSVETPTRTFERELIKIANKMNPDTFTRTSTRESKMNAFARAQSAFQILTHWGRVTHICVSRLTITGSDKGLLPGRCHPIIWTNAGILLIGLLRTNFGEKLIEILTFSFTKMRLKVSSAKWRPFCLGLNVLTLLQRTRSWWMCLQMI